MISQSNRTKNGVESRTGPEITGTVTNIQRFSVHDGPGIRTTVFLKGCNLRCFWCHNPEDMNPAPEIQFFPERCIHCGACLEHCPQRAHVEQNGVHEFLRERCLGCGQCSEECFAQGLVLVGAMLSVDEVMAEIAADAAFYASSGGGVTLSGGEPLLQWDFSYAILERCRQRGFHTAIETAANVSWSRLAGLLPVTDLVMVDIKLLDSARHQAATGAPNARILANATRLGEASQPLIVRTPVVPGVNDNIEDISAIAAFVRRLPNLQYYELLPYHPMAKSKYRSLSLDYSAEDLAPPSRAKMAELVAAARQLGIEVHTG